VQAGKHGSSGNTNRSEPKAKKQIQQSTMMSAQEKKKKKTMMSFCFQKSVVIIP
jgi:hypothetical protein